MPPRRYTHPFWFRILLLIPLLTGVLHTRAAAEIKQDDRDLVNRVWQRLLATIKERPQELAWPAEFVWPPFVEPSDNSEINAQAYVIKLEASAPQRSAPQFAPKVEVFEGILSKVVQDKADDKTASKTDRLAADRLAFILAHELGHHLRRHVTQQRDPRGTILQEYAYSRDQELEADETGVKLMLAAGYSFNGARTSIKRIIGLDLESSPWFALSLDHPSWSERMAALNTEEASLWRAMGAFRNGTDFLTFEQYEAAECCFDMVTLEFPSSYEAWANLGYARLMQYCDALNASDLRQFGVGQIVCGGFYQRPKSLQALAKGRNEGKWQDAVLALREALHHKPQLAVVKANLGVAYLVHFSGQPQVAEATKLLQEAAWLVLTKKDKTLEGEPLATASILINAGVAGLRGGQRSVCQQRLHQSAPFIRTFANSQEGAPSALSVQDALSYNMALLLESSSQPADWRKAKKRYESYLEEASSASLWRSLAAERYRRLCVRLKTTPRQITPIEPDRRPITFVRFGTDRLVKLSDSIEQVERHFGPAPTSPIPAGNQVQSLVYPDLGISLLVHKKQVVAIQLWSALNSPQLTIRKRGLGQRILGIVRVGMPQHELGRILGDTCEIVHLTKPDQEYSFYRDIGIAALFKGNKVAELVIVQIPVSQKEE
jgi:hypothetical protein